MAMFSSWRTLCAVLLTALVCACGGAGSSASAPVGGITVTPSNGQVTVSWAASPGVEYWLVYAATSSPLNVQSLPAGHVWVSPATSPYTVTGLTNGVTYTFAVNGRTNGGPGGPLTPSQSATPHIAGAHWLPGSGVSTSTALTGLSYGSSTADSLNYFVAVGNGGAIYKAQHNVSATINGYSWSALTSGVTTDFKAALYAFNKYIAVGANQGTNNIVSSADLTTWTPATWTPAGANINALASNGTGVLAVGDGGKAFYTADGTTWTSVTTGVTDNLYGLTYSSAVGWVAVGANGRMISSTDMLTWTSITSGTTNTLRGVAVTSSNVHVAVGDGGKVLTSSDGVNWTAQTPAGTNLLAVSTDSSQFLAVGQSGTVLTSPDGTTWTSVSQTASTQDLTAIYGSIGLYVVVGASGANIYSTY